MIFVFLLFFIALALSSVAAYYSIVGLLTIFPTAGMSIVIMGVTLECAKLISASWLYRNWNTSPIALKSYFTFSVVILSFITSMGIFGYLSKAHIDQKYSISDSTILSSNILREIQGEENVIKNAQKNLDLLDRLVTEADPKDANFIRTRQKNERQAINSEIRVASDKIKTLTSELLPLQQEQARAEAEIGPIKYVADFIYAEESGKQAIDKAVRWVILIIVVVFDPLAIILLIAANRELKIIEKPLAIKKQNVSNVDLDFDLVDKSHVHEVTKESKEIPKEILDKVFKKKK